jgi:hypothetical protein
VVEGKPVVDVSLAMQKDGQWQEQRLRLLYSAPRLLRDEIAGAGKWLPPKLAAMMGVQEAPAQDFASCAVALMPERREGTKDRFLLNFPLALDVTALPGRAVRVERWKGQFNMADDVLLHLHWPSTRELSKSKVVKETTPWHERLGEFSCLGVDLGQRAAAAVARLRVACEGAGIKEGKHAWDVGHDGKHEWKAELVTQRVLRLPGEEALVFDKKRGSEAVQELGGSVGRLASADELAEAQRVLDALGLSEEFRILLEDSLTQQLRASPDAVRYFPAQNDHLLRAFRRAQGHLAQMQNWLYLLKEERATEKVAEAVLELRKARFVDEELPENPSFKELRRLAMEKNWPLMQVYLTEQITARRGMLQTQLVAISNRVLPLRYGCWSWEEKLGNHTLVRQQFTEEERGAHTAPKIRGQRGLSLERIEQLEELRRRCQSLNRALKRSVGERAKLAEILWMSCCLIPALSC